MKDKYIMVTGGLGYIGSHLVVRLLEEDYQVIIVDNLANSSVAVLDNIKKISGKEVIWYDWDVTDYEYMSMIFTLYDVHAVFHLASHKAVGDSVNDPLEYYDNNCRGTWSLLKAMEGKGCKNFIFSSSACVYGEPQYLPIDESHPTNPTNPYGNTKLVNELMIKDFSKTGDYNVSILRYFNPLGSHPSRLLHESPNGKPNNLMPYICKVASGEYEYLDIYGNDYDTYDGTGVRDYIHVLDLVEGHILAMQKYNPGVHTYNLGLGVGHTVLEVLQEFESAHDVVIRYEISERRDGDVAMMYASNSLAKEELGWYPMHDLYSMCLDSWTNPKWMRWCKYE